MPQLLSSSHTIIIIMNEQFVDRERELRALKNAYMSDRAEMVIIYGRRRVGKTALVKRSVEGMRHIYFFAEETLERENLKNFRALVARYLNNPLVERADLGWEEIFEMLKDEGGVVIIDEFPNLIRKAPTILSRFQKIWDEILGESRVKLVLLGSSVSVMESHVLGYRSPLYGRRTSQIKLEPLKFHHLRGFFPHRSWGEITEIYGITDGIPAYIKEVKYRMEHGEKLHEVFLPGKMLFEEAEFLLKYELRDPARYFEILRAIASGCHKFGDIVNYTSFPSSTVSQYIHNLKTLNFVVEVHPVGERKRARNTRYVLSDNYIAFYFRFIYPNKSYLIEEGRIPNFREEYNRYLGRVFEKVGRQFLQELSRVGELPFRPTAFGAWWKKSTEVDCVGVDERGRRIMAFEVKWGEVRDGSRILRVLEKKVEGEFGGCEKFYGLIARRVHDKEALREKGYLVYDLDDFDRVFAEK